jgi:hypothetical protein
MKAGLCSRADDEDSPRFAWGVSPSRETLFAISPDSHRSRCVDLSAPAAQNLVVGSIRVVYCEGHLISETSPIRVIRSILSALALVALLTFQPMHGFYRFKRHYSAFRVSLKIEHHTYKAPPEPYAAPSVPRALVRPAPPSLTGDHRAISSNSKTPVIPIVLWLMRLKFSPPGAGAEATLI